MIESIKKWLCEGENLLGVIIIGGGIVGIIYGLYEGPCYK
jgi:hypothetical protein